MIKKFIQWLARVFDAEITVEKVVDKVVEKEKVVYRDRVKYLPPEGGMLEGAVEVDGDLVVHGDIRATGCVTCKALTFDKEETV